MDVDRTAVAAASTVNSRAAAQGSLVAPRDRLRAPGRDPTKYLPQQLAPVAQLVGHRSLGSLHQVLLEHLRGYDQVDLSRVSVMLQAWLLAGGDRPDSTDRSKAGSKRNLAVDACGTPLVLLLGAANAHDRKYFGEVIEALPSIPGLPGRPMRWPKKVHTDKGYDYKHCRESLRERRILPQFARQGNRIRQSHWAPSLLAFTCIAR